MKTILVIEDEADILDNISELLAGEGYRVVKATTGRSGIEEAHRHEPDLILCDVMMPEVDGHAVLQALRTSDALTAVPFIFLTARTTPDDVRTGMNLGADDYLTKPFRAVELLDAVASRLNRQEALRQQQEAEIEKLRADLSQVIPHELRTPLSAVVGFSRFLLDDWDNLERDTAREMIQHVHEAGHRLERLVENYSLFARLEVLTDDDVHTELDGVTPDAAAIVEETARRCAHLLDREHDVRLETETAVLPLQDTFLAKLVEEVVTNALKFSEGGTPVTVQGRCHDAGYVLKVTDRGRGMTAAQVERVGAFRQFDRQKQEQQGLGLGLALVRRLTQLHDGALELDSTPGTGTTVTVRLPLAHTLASVA